MDCVQQSAHYDHAMNATATVPGRWMPGLISAWLVLLLAGCATHKVDWAARVGTFTLDQAILELGPPDKQAKLQDGTVVAEWLTRRGRTYTSPAYAPYSPYGMVYSGSIDTTPDYFLRLLFDADGRLKAWKKFAK
jgi:hypothetical protein